MPAPPAETTVVFAAPFRLAAFDGEQPAGTYRVEHLWEAVEGLTQTGYRRTGTYLHLPAIGTPSMRREAVPVDWADLDAALEKDQRP